MSDVPLPPTMQMLSDLQSGTVDVCRLDAAMEYAAAISAAQNARLREALTGIVNTYDAYRRRGVAPAPAEYANVVDAIEKACAALKGT